MKQRVLPILNALAPVIDIVLLPLVLISALVMKFVRRVSTGGRLPLARKTLLSVGVFPIREHYYEPMFNPKHLKKPLSQERNLPGIDLNVDGQLQLLRSFKYGHEFESIPDRHVSDTTYHFNNGSFESGDAEYWYSLIRLKKPRRIIEIGSGNSTKMARLAIAANTKEDPGYTCTHICIEPYEMPWLEKIGVEVIRKRVEDVEPGFFYRLQAGDVLFIDSSHIIRPQGDVLVEFLEVLPTVNPGVIVHVHDIFTPRDYPEEWVVKDVRLWNEQYILEAFLTCNSEWKVIGAVNYLRHNHFELLRSKCPRLKDGREPGSFYLVRS